MIFKINGSLSCFRLALFCLIIVLIQTDEEFQNFNEFEDHLKTHLNRMANVTKETYEKISADTIF